MAADIVLIIMGLTICFLLMKPGNKRLKKNGNKVAGIIVDGESTIHYNDGNIYPSVKFTTQKNELFTLTSTEGYLPARVKTGKKVTVFYDPQNPRDFTIVLPNEQLMFVTLIAAALLFTVAGAILLLNELGIIHLLKK
jgi:hypothetical protein